MNKYLKGCLIILGTGILFIAGSIGWYHYYKFSNAQQAQTDEVKFTKICDNYKVVTEMPAIMLVGFDTVELRKVRFYLIRQGRSIRDTVLELKSKSSQQFVSIQIPFTQFLKTDTILVETGKKFKRFYELTGFHHYAYLHYGLMGYLGTYDCRLDDKSFLVNGKLSDGQLLRKFGRTRSIITEQVKL